MCIEQEMLVHLYQQSRYVYDKCLNLRMRDGSINDKIQNWKCLLYTVQNDLTEIDSVFRKLTPYSNQMKLAVITIISFSYQKNNKLGKEDFILIITVWRSSLGQHNSFQYHVQKYESKSLYFLLPKDSSFSVQNANSGGICPGLRNLQRTQIQLQFSWLNH